LLPKERRPDDGLGAAVADADAARVEEEEEALSVGLACVSAAAPRVEENNLEAGGGGANGAAEAMAVTAVDCAGAAGRESTFVVDPSSELESLEEETSELDVVAWELLSSSLFIAVDLPPRLTAATTAGVLSSTMTSLIDADGVAVLDSSSQSPDSLDKCSTRRARGSAPLLKPFFKISAAAASPPPLLVFRTKSDHST